jgi:hypothetical protein
MREPAMSDDLDLSVIDQRHEPDPQFRAALQRRVAAIASGEPMAASSTEARDVVTVELEPSPRHSASGRRRHRVVLVRLTVAAVAAAVLVAVLAVVISRDTATAPVNTPTPINLAHRTFDPGETSPLQQPSQAEVTLAQSYGEGGGQVEVTAKRHYVELRCSLPGASLICPGSRDWAYDSGTVGKADYHYGMLGNATEVTLSALDDRYLVASTSGSSPSAWLIDSVTGRRGVLTWNDQPAILNAPQQWLVLFHRPNTFDATRGFLPRVVDTRDWTVRPLAVPADATAALEISQPGFGPIWVGTAPNGGMVGLAYSDDGGASWTHVQLPQSSLRITSEQLLTVAPGGDALLVVAAAQHSVAVANAWGGEAPILRDVFVSADDGAHWTPVPVNPAVDENGTTLFALPNGRLVVEMTTDPYLQRLLVSRSSSDWSQLSPGYTYSGRANLDISQRGVAMLRVYETQQPLVGDHVGDWTIPNDQKLFELPSP